MSANLTLPFYKNAKDHPERLALSVNQRDFTYGDLAEVTERIAGWLQDRSAGDRAGPWDWHLTSEGAEDCELGLDSRPAHSSAGCSRLLLRFEHFRASRKEISDSRMFSFPGSSFQFGLLRNRMERKTAIREFLRNLLARKGDSQPFSDETSVLLSGRLQSVDAVELAVFLEENFGVDFATMGFDQERIDTVNAISSLIEESSMLGK
jgi:acyl carrier protein